MIRNNTAISCVLGLVVGIVAIAHSNAASPVEKRFRIGVYDPRAIAIAWAGSDFNPVKAKRAALEAAKKSGDQQQVKELEAWGPAQQRLLHFQGFGHVPVGDLLLPVNNGVERIAKAKGLSAIAMECDDIAPNVQVVDVSEELAALFVPVDKAHSIVGSLKNAKPLGLLEIADLKEND